MKIILLILCLPFITFSIILTLSCETMNTPIIIREIPEINLNSSDDIYTNEEKKLIWTKNLLQYIDELINQIKHKVKYIIIHDDG